MAKFVAGQLYRLNPEPLTAAMAKFVAGQLYRLNPEPLTAALASGGYLWIYVYYDARLDSHRFKSVATGEITWWPQGWMEELEAADAGEG